MSAAVDRLPQIAARDCRAWVSDTATSTWSPPPTSGPTGRCHDAAARSLWQVSDACPAAKFAACVQGWGRDGCGSASAGAIFARSAVRTRPLLGERCCVALLGCPVLILAVRGTAASGRGEAPCPAVQYASTEAAGEPRRSPPSELKEIAPLGSCAAKAGETMAGPISKSFAAFVCGTKPS